MTQPLDWHYRKDDALTGAIKAYLCDEPLGHDQIGLLREYLGDWAEAMPHARDLADRIPYLVSRQAIDRWLDDALDMGIDPL